MRVQVQDLSFAYPKAERDTIKDVSFSVDDDHVCAVVGSNGTGKSTLIKCIDGIYPIKSGKVMFGDRDLAELRPRERAALVGYVPQSNELRMGLSVFDVILSGRTPHMRYRPTDEDITVTENIIRRLSLERFAFRSVTALSGGERQRVLIGRAMAQTPSVMLLDEPTSSLDMRYQLEIMELLRELSREAHITVITVMHDLNAVLRSCDEVLVMHEGGAVAYGAPETVLECGLIERVYGIRAAMGSVNGRSFILPESLTECV